MSATDRDIKRRKEIIEKALKNKNHLNDWEIKFLDNIKTYPQYLTWLQERSLLDIADKYGF